MTVVIVLCQRPLSSMVFDSVPYLRSYLLCSCLSIHIHISSWFPLPRLLDISFSYFLVDTFLDFFNGFSWLFLLHHMCSLSAIVLGRFMLDRSAAVFTISLLPAEVRNDGFVSFEQQGGGHVRDPMHVRDGMNEQEATSIDNG
jgi:hypothetical protein